MSRIGKQPVIIPENVQIEIKDNLIKVSGPKGNLEKELVPGVEVLKKDKEIVVSVQNKNDKEQRSKWGLQRSLINSMVIGVVDGFSKQLEINGVGYKASIHGQKLLLNVGHSHSIEYDIKEGIEINIEKNIITVQGIDKQLVGQVASEIRAFRKPEPYKGKGIKYVDEVIRRKAGKVAKTVAS